MNLIEAYATVTDTYLEGVAGFDTYVEAFQLLLDTGEVWLMPGRYGRACASLMSAGYVHSPEGQQHI